MLSIGAMKAGQSDYYTNLAREDYYLTGGEPEGRWDGSGAKALGLSGIVTKNELSRLFEGFSSEGIPLVQNAGKSNRQSGWDLTFSAPKSVSFLWSQLDQRRQEEIQIAHQKAVAAAINYLERHRAFSRIGKAGAERIPANLVVALFEHSCSRAFDMQLHTHALVLNLGIDDNGVARSILSSPIYQSKMLVGAFYRCELASQIRERLGLDLERPRSRYGKVAWFEVTGISAKILAHFSKRREAILKELNERGLESASAAAFAALGTREPKTIVPPRSELHARWKAEGRELGFEPEQLATQTQKLSLPEVDKRFQAVLAEAVAIVTDNKSSFTQSDLIRTTLEIAQEHCLPAEYVAGRVAENLVLSPDRFVSLGARDGQAVWTTREVLQLEGEFCQNVQQLRERRFRGVSNSMIESVLGRPRGEGKEQFLLDVEQQEAVRYIAQGKESVKCISGFAGTGKTQMLAAAKEALESEGYRVIGAALAGVAARALQENAGIESSTIRAREYQLYPDASTVWKHHASQLWRAAKGQETWAFPKLTIDHKTVLIVDEAGMVGVRDFQLLARAVVEQGGSLLAVGDHRQLAAIERPGAFEFLVNELEGASLTKIRRQRDIADQHAVTDIVAGDPEAALRHYAKKGQFFVGPDKSQVEEALVSDWRRHGGAIEPSEHRIFAATRAEVQRLNQLCQWERVQAGALDASERVSYREQLFMVGDQVRFDASARALGIRKGEQGTILAVKEGFTGKYVSVALDADEASLRERFLDGVKHHAKQMLNAAIGERTERLSRRQGIVVVPLECLNPQLAPYRGLSLDYAMTTHLGQGQTVANSYVLLGGGMTNRELSYVQASRHQANLYLYATAEQAGAPLTELAAKHRPPALLSSQRAADAPARSPLVEQMKCSASESLASNYLRKLQTHEQETTHVVEP
ncbi:MobF family relaxase [Lacipirellula sp.]|uniref:MobF family relaxase n=1 Tax=Lacipirellula sp. TaxID=2691419 RepID=UPI003D12053B